jgi:hypothetical protein
MRSLTQRQRQAATQKRLQDPQPNPSPHPSLINITHSLPTHPPPPTRATTNVVRIRNHRPHNNKLTKERLSQMEGDRERQLLQSIEQLRIAQLEAERGEGESREGLLGELLEERLMRGQGLEGLVRLGREEASLRLKEKVKNKLSRRHIYHTLKPKSDTASRLRSRTQPAPSAHPPLTLSLYHSFRLHCQDQLEDPEALLASIQHTPPHPRKQLTV